MDKSKMSEQDICLKYITPSIQQSGWDIMTQIRTEYTFTDGQVIVRGKISTRGKRLRADYLLSYKNNLPVAVVEAKDNNKPLGTGLQQAINYAVKLDLPLAYCSNGDAFIEHDFTNGMERKLSLEEFPNPQYMWSKYKQWKGIETPQQELIIEEPYHYEMGSYAPRYYQRVAINRTLEAVAKGKDRLLLVMATGTGKTYTAFQIMWRLWKSKRVKRILYLADRNFLIDQTISGDFKPFDKSLTKVKNRNLDSSYEIHMALYQQLVGNDGEKIFEAFQPNFFDLIVVDECHRGSAREDSQWRQILDYFSSAIHLGLTATPKETSDISTLSYFGTEPIYTYSLREGIQDGFLAPYKVMRVGLNVDLEGWRPYAGQTDEDGDEIADREYNTKDYDKNLVIDERTKEVAKRITEYLKNSGDRYQKTVVFCTDIDHADRMRVELAKLNADMMKESPNYVVKITGDDLEGKAQIDNFISVNNRYPVIATTSELLSTGCDIKMCKLIVIDKEINSMITFKQILGRGTRIREEDGKTHFTLMDFRGVSRLFSDPTFDGDPVVIIEVPPEGPTPGGEEEPTPDGGDGPADPPGGPGPDGGDGWDDDGDDPVKKDKVYVKGVFVKVLNERVQYLDTDGKLITESVKAYSKKHILDHFDSLETFIRSWSEADKKQAIIDELKDDGVLLEALREEYGQEISDFDLILHVAFNKKPLTRAERVNNVKKRGYLYKHSETAQKVLEGLLDKYKDAEIVDLRDTKILELKPFDEMGTPIKLVKEFGSKQDFIKAVTELEAELYAETV